MGIELLSSKSVSHTVYVLNHALIKAKIELDAGSDSIKPFKMQEILNDMVKDLIQFGNDKNKDRDNIIEKVKLVSDKTTSDTALDTALPKINEGILDEMEQVRDVIEIIISGKISKLEQNKINEAQRILWDFFCQVRVPNRLE
jgi:hypothetical protein